MHVHVCVVLIIEGRLINMLQAFCLGVHQHLNSFLLFDIYHLTYRLTTDCSFDTA